MFYMQKFIFPRYFNGLTVLFCQSLPELWIFEKHPTKLRNEQILKYLKLKAIFSNVGRDLEMNQC